MESEKALISWWSWPARQQPVRSVFAWIIILLSVFLCSKWSFFLSLGISVALISSLSEVLLPTLYRIKKMHISVYSLHIHRSIPWAQVKTVKQKERGFLLTIDAYQDRKKNLFLYCNSNKEKIGLVLEQKIVENQT